MSGGDAGSALGAAAAAELTALFDAVAAEGARRHAAWVPARFRAFESAARALDAAGAARPTLVAYLECVREGVAAGALRGRPGQPATLLELCLYTFAPAELARLPAERAVSLLAATWNLCEGLAAEPEWMGRWVLARSVELRALAELADFLVRALEPVLAAPARSTFSAELAVSVLDTRAADAEFLPGALALIAPTVLSVRDRRRPVELAVALRHGGKSELLGRIVGGGPYAAEGPTPAVELGEQALTLGGAMVELPLLGSPLAHFVVPAGFVVVTAHDSQRLWVVEAR